MRNTLIIFYFFYLILLPNLSHSDVVKDPELIKKLDKIREDNEIKRMKDHKKRFDSIYFDQYIKCTNSSFFKKDDIIYFGLPLKYLHQEIHSDWNEYDYDFKKWHVMDKMNQKYYIFHKEPGSHKDNLELEIYYKIDRETGVMEEFNKKLNTFKKIRKCEKISYSDLPMLKTEVKF